MTPNEAKVLVIVGRNGILGFVDLEQALPEIKFGFLVRALDGLHAQKLINKKRYRLKLTQRGTLLYKAIKEVWDG